MRTTMAIGLAALLTACGGGSTSSSTTTTTTTGNGAVTTTSTSNSARIGRGADGRRARAATIAARTPISPPVYAGGTIKVCSSAHFEATHKTSGSFSYTTAAAPAAVLAWSKEQAAKSGPRRAHVDRRMLSIGEGNKRMMVVFARPEGSGSRVTVNWTKPD